MLEYEDEEGTSLEEERTANEVLAYKEACLGSLQLNYHKANYTTGQI